MQTLRNLRQTIADQTGLRALAEIYEDIALFNMQRIRGQVLSMRQFLAGVSEIYTLAKTAYLAQIPTTISGRPKPEALSFVLRNGKTVVVLISGNEPLLGNIMLAAYKVFLALSAKLSSDLVICGQIGRYLASQARPLLVFKYFDLDDYRTSELQLAQIFDYTRQYAKILVVYPRFESVLSQVPQIDDISGGVSLEKARVYKKNYFFEPSPREVMSYFESQIIKLLLYWKMLEAMLARFSARLTILDAATQTIEKKIAKNRAFETRLTRREDNKGQMVIYAGISLWGKDEG